MPPVSAPLAVLDRVRVTLGGVRALDGVSLAVRRGGHLALTGPNGSGKSTLLRVLRGEMRPDQKDGGSVVWFPDGNTPDDAPLAGRAMTSLLSPALQEKYARQSWNIRGEELVLSGLYDDYLLYRQPSEQERALAADLARPFRAERLLDLPANTFSQGQLRLVLLLRALIRRPALLLLDEALDGLDAPTRTAFLLTLEELARRPDAPTMILATHRRSLPGFVRATLRMEQGRIAEGPESGQSAERATPPPPLRGRARSGNVRIAVRNATVFVERAEVLHAVSWRMEPGEQWVVAGGNGAGKSTLLRLLAGDENAAAGGGVTRAIDNGELRTLEEIQQRIRMVSDRLQALYPYDESAAGVVFSGLCGSLGVYREPEPEERAEVRCRLAEVGMEELAERPFRSLSTGQARKVLLARALAGNPALLLLDEPFSGLDAASRQALIDIVEARIRDGLQTVLVSHHAGDRLPSSTHEAVLEDGRIVSQGPLGR